MWKKKQKEYGETNGGSNFSSKESGPGLAPNSNAPIYSFQYSSITQLILSLLSFFLYNLLNLNECPFRVRDIDYKVGHNCWCFVVRWKSCTWTHSLIDESEYDQFVRFVVDIMEKGKV